MIKKIITRAFFYLCSLLILLSHTSLQALSKDQYQLSQLELLSQDPFWLKLGHYQTNKKNKFKGEIDGENFYLAKEGRFDPLRELDATVKAFNLDIINQGDPKRVYTICQYPLRYTWLVKQQVLAKEKFNLQESCPTFSDWFDRIHAKSAVLVFAGSYLNNPSSMFGHTFLRFKKTDQEDQQTPAMLDYVVNFAANTGNEGGLLYTIKGLFGQYPGIFSTFPYHVKINEYTNIESRDLWEYHLNLNQTQIDFLVMHLWELSKTHFDYFFIDENCSYFLLSLLELNNPKHDLIDKLPFFTAPVDTIKVLKSKTDWIEKTVHRLSTQQIYEHRLKALSRASKKTAVKMIRKKNIPDLSFYSQEEKKQIFDTVIDYQKYKNRKMIPSDYEKELWVKRSHFSSADPVSAAFTNDPTDSHPTMRFGLGAQYNENFLVNIYFRGAYHDQLNLQDGLNNLSHIEALNGKIKFNVDTKKMMAPELSIVNIISLSPFKKINKKPSWNIDLSVEDSYRKSCYSCSQVRLSFGPGISLGQFDFGVKENKRLLGFAFLNSYNALSLYKNLNSWVGPELETGVLFDVGQLLANKLSFSYAMNALDDFSMKKYVRAQHALHLSKTHELRFDYRFNFDQQDVSLYYLYYF